MSHKNLDRRGRWRNKTIAFRVSPEENEAINIRAQISGLSKQEYLCRRSMEQDITVIGNPRVYKALKEQMIQIHADLQHIAQGEQVDADLLETIRIVAVTFGGLNQ